jgi:uncharacterized protein GlcG (DUF336 family)
MPTGRTPVIPSLTLADAQRMMAAALERADAIGQAMNVTIVDATAFPLMFVRQDGAKLGSIDISQRKARTALLTGRDTAELGREAQPGQPLYGIEATNGGLVLFGGGVLVRDSDDRIVGAIGVSAGTVDEDLDVAWAGVKAYLS